MSGGKPDLTDLKRRMGIIADKTNAPAKARELLGVEQRYAVEDELPLATGLAPENRHKHPNAEQMDCEPELVPQRLIKHVFVEHEPGCEIPHCSICLGGLAVCSICNQAEGELEPSCPGSVVEERPEREEAVEPEPGCARCNTLMENGYVEHEDGRRFCSWQCRDTVPPTPTSLLDGFNSQIRKDLAAGTREVLERAEYDQTLEELDAGLITPDEGRRRLGLQPMPEPEFFPADPAQVWYDEGKRAGINEAIRALIDTGRLDAVEVLLEYDKTKERT